MRHEQRGLIREIAVAGAVLLASAAILKALDYVPSVLAGVSPRVQLYTSLDDAERGVGARIWLPGYYPDELQWPPARIEVSFDGPVTIGLRVAGRRGSGERLLITQSIGYPATPPPALLPAGVDMETTEVQLGQHRATLARVLVGTSELHDVRWDQRGRRITLRYSGPVERLLTMASSLERTHQ